MAPPRRVALPGGPLRSRLLTLGRGATPLAARQPDCWSVPAFGAKWIISGRQKVRCGRPACMTNAYSWHNLQLVHRLGDYHGTPIINLLPSNSSWRRHNGLSACSYHWTCCHGETIADWPCCGHVHGTDTAARCKGTGIGSIVAGRPSYGSGWRIEVTVGPYWLLAPNG